MPHATKTRKRFTKWRIDLAIHDALAVASQRKCNRPFQQLLAVVISRSDMLRPHPLNGRMGWTDCERILRGLLSLSGCNDPRDEISGQAHRPDRTGDWPFKAHDL